MAAVFRSLRTALPALRRPVAPTFTVARAFSASVARPAHHEGPPQLIGPGGKVGQVPTDEEQSTGLERFELMGKLEGIDVFDTKPLEMTRLGTVEDPIAIYSLAPTRQVGCTGFPADSHDTVWINVTHDRKDSRCPECGSVYALNFQGDEAALHGGHHH
ncbi:hypothetical protein IAT38_002044 [Cryptococcus sp. DSM 104549]